MKNLIILATISSNVLAVTLSPNDTKVCAGYDKNAPIYRAKIESIINNSRMNSPWDTQQMEYKTFAEYHKKSRGNSTSWITVQECSQYGYQFKNRSDLSYMVLIQRNGG